MSITRQAPPAARPAVRPARLDPVGRLRLPRRPTLLRAMLVAALLLTAAGVLYSGGTDGRENAASDQDPATATVAPTVPGWLPGDPDNAQDPGDPDNLDDPAAPAEDGARQPIPEGMVGVPVPLAEPAALAVLRPGDRVDLLSIPGTGGEPVSMAAGAAVLAVDRASSAVLLSLTEDQARAVLSAPATTGFAVVVRP